MEIINEIKTDNQTERIQLRKDLNNKYENIKTENKNLRLTMKDIQLKTKKFKKTMRTEIQTLKEDM